MAEKLILASKSKARRALLANAGLHFETQDPCINERDLEAIYGAEPKRLALTLAAEKAKAIS